MKDRSDNTRDRWAYLRFSIIGRLLASPPPKGQLGQEIKKLSKKTYRHPTEAGRWISFGASTIERWYYQALEAQDPIVMLGRKIRSDSGRARVMSPALLSELHQQYKLHPRWSYQLHFDNLAALVLEKPELAPMPSYATVRRRMQQRGWRKKRPLPRKATEGQQKAADRLESREVRSFEAAHVHALWHSDFHHGRLRVVDEKGQWHTPKALAVLDDRSRLVCHAQWFFGETTQAFVHGLCQAFAKRGLPRALMTDNGSAMTAQETLHGLLRLGIQHDTTLPYSPYQNGKQEKLWDQLEGRLISMLERIEPLTLAFLNRATQAWVELEYNKKEHEEIGTTPLERMLEGPDVSRPAPDSEKMRHAFTVQATRSQRRSDGTITLDGIRFEVPSRLRHLPRLHLRYQSWDLSRAYLVDSRDGSLLARIHPLDKTRNANGCRRTLEPLDGDACQVIPVGNQEAIPPLMRQLLARYAATGLPPAYLPLNEGEDQTDE